MPRPQWKQRRPSKAFRSGGARTAAARLQPSRGRDHPRAHRVRGGARPHRARHPLVASESRDALHRTDREKTVMNITIAPSRVFAAILRRDVRVAMRELPLFLLRTTMQPLLFVTIFGYLMPKMGIMPRSYTALMLPGILALSLTLFAIQSV